MNKKMMFAAAFLALAGCAMIYSASQPVGAAQPGDATDPLVTRRYVDARIGELSAQVSRLEAMLEGGGTAGFQPAPGSQPAPGTGLPGGAPPPAEGGLPSFSAEQIAMDVLAMVESRLAGILAQPQVVPFDIYSVPAGQRLYFEAGAEFILRTGTAVAITGEVGFVDITAGRDVLGGETISHNHLHLVPADDGRGLRFDTGGWIMIKGGYRVAE